LKILSKNPVGVTIKKKIINITIGGTIFPRISPNFIHRKLKGLRNSGLTKDKTNKKAEMNNPGNLIELPLKTGQTEISKKKNEKTSPNVFSGDLRITAFYTIFFCCTTKKAA